MAALKKGIGDTYQQETKYARDSLGGYDPRTSEPSPPFKTYPDAAEKVQLPSPACTKDSELWQILKKRRSERNFTDYVMPREELFLLLFAVQGVTAEYGEYLFRTAPSAGGLFPVETYLMINSVDAMTKGIYHLNVLDSCLERIKTGNLSGDLVRAALGQTFVASASVTFIWTAISGRSKWKYRERAYRYIYLDAGHIAANLSLSATSINLGTCQIAALYDDEVNNIINIDGTDESTIYLSVVGLPLGE